MKFEQILNEAAVIDINDFLNFYRDNPRLSNKVIAIGGPYGSKISYEEALKYVEKILGKEALKDERLLSMLKSKINLNPVSHRSTSKIPKWHPNAAIR